MRTRSQSRRRRQQQTLPVVVENFDLEEPIVDQNIVAMADNRTMAQMLQAPIEGYEDAIVVPPINANNFELKQPLINLVQSNKFTDGEARDWLDKEPPRSILTWDDLVSKFINQFFPPSKTTYLRNKITNFFQEPNETFNEAWERFKGQVFQPPINQPPVYQVPPFQAPTPQIQGVSKTDFENYVKANDAVLKNVQNQGQNLQNQMANVTSLSGKTLEAPSTPLVPTPDVSNPQNEPNLETLTEKVQNPNLEKTAHVPSPEEEESIFIEIPKPKAKKTVNIEVQDLNSPRPNSYSSKLPYPERMKIRLKDALVEMPKFNKWLSSLLRNKEKLEEIAITTVNAECSAIIMNKVPEKLEDPGKFLILCALQELNRTSALADSGASINLLPHSIYKKLELEALILLVMTTRALPIRFRITHPMGIAEDVVVRVDGFTFLADFVVVNFEPDPRVPIILGRPFLRTAKALIDLYEEKLTLRVGKEELVYYADKSEKHKEKNFVHAISIIDFSKDDPFSGSTTNTLLPSSSPVKTSDNLEKFADELAPLDSLPPGNDDSTFKKDLHEETFQVYSNPLFEFDDNFKSSNVNPLFEENDMDAEIKFSSSFTLTSPEEIEEIKIKEKEDEISSEIPIHTIVMPIRITFDHPIDFNAHFSKPKDLKKDLTVLFDSTESSILPSPLLESDSPFTAELSASVTLNSLGNEDKVFKPGILIYHAIPDKNLVTLEKNLKENISSGTLLVFKEPSFLLPPPEPPDKCLNFEPILVMKNVVLNEDFYQSNVEDVNSFTIIIWIFLPFFTNTKESPLLFSFRCENFVFDLGIVTFHKPVDQPNKFFEASRVRLIYPVQTRASHPLCEISLGRSDILSS
ncbi:reverse transcriptase domain-containing protein [Tanacetum coccineum]